MYNPLYDYQKHMVISVIDGDTIRLEDGQRVRLLGIQSPEVGECMATEATTYLRSLIGGKQVRIEKDITGSDKYERLLRYVYIENPNPKEDNILVNSALVKNGFAIDKSYGADNRYRDQLVQSREHAKRYSLGIWNQCPNFIQANTRNKTQSNSAPADPNCVIKGNISVHGHGLTYFLPGCGNYSRVKVSTSTGEQYFCTTDEAEAAGFTISTNCATNNITP